MTMLQKRRNDLFSNRSFLPRLWNLDNEFFNNDINIPPANIVETNQEFKLELSAPGLKKEDFKIDIDHGVLTISNEKEEEIKEEEKNYSRREFSYSSFSRSFQLPENIDENNINAKYDNGMLLLNIPKKEVSIAKSKSIKVS